MNRQILSLDKIKTDGGTQARAALNEDVVAEYAEAIKAGADLPPVVIFLDGKRYWLADGFHRFHAYRKAGAIQIEAEILIGTKRDAILHSVGANASHGLRRTNADKRSAVETLLADSEWRDWSDREIAKACRVSHTFVSNVRTAGDGNVASERRFITKHGTESTMDVSAIGRVESDSTPEAQAEPQSHSPAPPASTGAQPALPVAALAADVVPPSEVPLPAGDQEGDSRADQLSEVEELRQHVVELTDILTGFDAASEGEKAAAAEITRLTTQLRVVESQRDQYMLTCTEIKRQVKALQRENARLLALVPQEAA